MKHRIIAYAFMLLSVVIGGVCTQAQTVGEWKLYSLFNGGIDKVIDAKNKVYYLSAQRLYSYDKTSHETYSYSTDNVLNDTNITNIFYNVDKGYLLVIYDTANIDAILDKDDTVVNMSDIVNANLTYTKTINDVKFKNDRIYISTTFGLVVYNDNKFTVVESGIYGKNIQYICLSQDKLLAYTDENKYYIADATGHLNTFDKFALWRSGVCKMLVGTDNGFYEYDGATKVMTLRKMDWETPATLESVVTDITPLTYNKNQNGDCYFVTASEIVYISEADGSILNRVTLPEGVASQQIDFSKDLSSIWAGDASGLANYNIADGSVTVLAAKSTPEAITCDNVAYIRPSKDGSRVYISNIGTSTYKSNVESSNSAEWVVQRTDYIQDGVPHNAAVYDASAYKSWVIKYRTQNNSTAMYGGVGRFDVDPKDPERYVIANNFEGFYVVKNNEEVGRFDSENMNISNWYSPTSARGAFAFNVEFDPQGNLWCGYWPYKLPNGKVNTTGEYGPYLMLPRKYLDGDLSAVTKDCWQDSKHKGVDIGNKDMGSLFCKHSTIWFTWHGAWQNTLGVYQTQGTYDDVSDDVYFELEDLKDTDGGTFKPNRWICAAEDQNGAVWFGTTSGVGVLSKPAEVTASTQIARPKVPRNDGTNYADYLLDSEQINDISVDAANRKWICTENSGLYCVSADGSEIIENFTTDNSPLPSNTIYSVYCDPNSNLVYVGLSSGLMTYRTTTAPAQSDYSAVLAYPNPVRPEYTGWISISGLMDNSLVKIADASGNVVYQARSNGGMVVWDGCNPDGSRVNTGVYLVLASENENDSATSVVTKILVVK